MYKRAHVLRLLATAATTATIALLPGTAHAAPADQVIRGSGLEACPQEMLCLYQSENFNRSAPAGANTIWAYQQSNRLIAEDDANDKALSAFNNTNNDVHLYSDADYVGHCLSIPAYSSEPRLSEALLTAPNAGVSSLSFHSRMTCPPRSS